MVTGFGTAVQNPALEATEHQAFLVVTKPYRQGKAQLPFLCLIELAAEEAPAQQMKFGAGHGLL